MLKTNHLRDPRVSSTTSIPPTNGPSPYAHLGDVLPVTDAERALSVVVMMIGGVCYSDIIATMASIVNTMDASERQFNEKMVRSYFDVVLKWLKFYLAARASPFPANEPHNTHLPLGHRQDCIGSYCSKQNFPQQLLKRVRRYYKHYYKQRTALDESEILEGLSARLQEDVAQHLIGRIMTNVPVFKGVSTDQWARVLVRPHRWHGQYRCPRTLTPRTTTGRSACLQVH